MWPFGSYAIMQLRGLLPPNATQGVEALLSPSVLLTEAAVSSDALSFMGCRSGSTLIDDSGQGAGEFYCCKQASDVLSIIGSSRLF